MYPAASAKHGSVFLGVGITTDVVFKSNMRISF